MQQISFGLLIIGPALRHQVEDRSGCQQVLQKVPTTYPVDMKVIKHTQLIYVPTLPYMGMHRFLQWNSCPLDACSSSQRQSHPSGVNRSDSIQRCLRRYRCRQVLMSFVRLSQQQACNETPEKIKKKNLLGRQGEGEDLRLLALCPWHIPKIS